MEGTDYKPRSHRLRLGRRSIAEQLYLITTVTYQRQPIFRDIYLGRILVNALQAYEQNAYTLCYVIMPDHLHWLMALGQGHNLSGIVGGIKRYSGRQINQELNRQGRFWQKGFHDRAIRKEEDVKSVARYIVANPLRAGLVRNIGDYSLWDAVWL